MTDSSFKHLLVSMRDSIAALKNEKACIVFGTGKFAREALSLFNRRNVEVIGFIDNDPTRHGTFLGKPVYGADYLAATNAPVVLCSSWTREILEQLNLIGYKGKIYVVDPWLSIFDDFSLSNKKLADIFAFYLLLDQTSRVIFEGLIGFRAGIYDALKVSGYQQYFHPAMAFNEHDVIIDGGAYIGDTVLAFEQNGTRVKAFHCFEPDADNFEKLCRLDVVGEQYNNNIGLWSDSGSLRFSSSDESASYGCSIKDSGCTVINVTSIDTYCQQHELVPTVIKIDIEGAEREALSGAENTIKKHKPKLAISVYHRYDDIWQIQQIIHDIRPDYTFHLGHHTGNWMETILYAV